MSIQIVADQNYLFDSWIVNIEQLFDFKRPVYAGLALSYGYSPPVSQRLYKHKIVRRSLAFIFHVIAFWTARFAWNLRAGFCYQLHRLLIHADQGFLRIVRLFVQIQDVLHVSDKIRVLFWRDAPHLFEVRF